jgi:uncharacterized protein (TIGR04255 family)
VALTYGFEAHHGIRQAHLGLYWERIRREFPKTVDRGALDPLPDMRVAPGDGVTFTLQIGNTPPVHRAWFLDEDESRLIQVQADRFATNWRIVGEGEYPHFESIYDDFVQRLTAFEATLDDTGTALPRPTTLEVLYVNWIEAESMSEFFAIDPLSPVADRIGDGVRSEHFAHTYGIVTGDAARATLAVDLRAGRAPSNHRQASTPGWVLQFTYRAPMTPEMDDTQLGRAYWVGRNTIVRAFESMTTPVFHQRWGIHR